MFSSHGAFLHTSSSYSIFRLTLGVVGASGKSEIDADFSSRSFDVVMWCWTTIVVIVSLSPFSNCFTAEFSLSSSKSLKKESWSLVVDSPLLVPSKGIVMVTLKFCTLRIDGVSSSLVSHLWFKHSIVLRRLLKKKLQIRLEFLLILSSSTYWALSRIVHFIKSMASSETPSKSSSGNVRSHCVMLRNVSCLSSLPNGLKPDKST